MTIKNLSEELSGCAYPGRGIVAGMSEDGKKAVSAYFIMGRSESSRNRVFVQDGEGIRTEAFDPSTLLVAPELIIYALVRVLGNNTIVTNGDQTDTVYDGLSEGKTFEESLRTREFEPDGPNYTPRISAVLHLEKGKFNYAMSILKSNNGNPDASIGLDILMAAKYFERIGDHAVNIAEWVEYSITGNHRSGSSHTDNYFVED